MSMMKDSTNESTAAMVVYNILFEDWIIYQVFSSLLILICLYICIVLAYYSYVKTCGRSRRPQFKGSTTKIDRDNANDSSSNGRVKGGFTSSDDERKRKRGGKDKAARLLRRLCLCAALFALVRISADQLELATYGSERVDCTIYQVVVVVSYAVSATFNYSALWFRLRLFISNPMMKHVASKLIRNLVWLALAAIIGSSLLNTFIFIITTSTVDSETGCKLGNTTSISPAVRYVILTISTVLTQGLLLSLFLYPLIKHRITMKQNSNAFHPKRDTVGNNKVTEKIKNSQLKSASDTEAGQSKFSSKSATMKSFRKSLKIDRRERLFAIMRRVMITAVVCVISDIVTAIVTIALNNHPRVASNIFFNANLLVNIFSVLCSFGDWQERIFPCCASFLVRKRRNKSASSIATLPTHMDQDKHSKNKIKPDLWRQLPESTASTPASSTPLSEIKKDDDVFINE